MFQEEGDFEYSMYIKEKTGYEVDILQNLYTRIDKIFSKGKITTETQYRDIMSLLNNVPEADKLDKTKRERLNEFLIEYENRKVKKS